MMKHAFDSLANLAYPFVRGRHSFNVIALAAVIALWAVGQVHAETVIWEGSVDEDWDYFENWDTFVVPTSEDDAIVDNGTTAQVQTDGAEAKSLKIGTTVKGSTVEIWKSGNLTIGEGNVEIGSFGTLVFSNEPVPPMIALFLVADNSMRLVADNVTNVGTVMFNQDDLVAFGGVISGSGSVQQNGTGTTVLLGENTYTGGTTINAGTLQLGNGGKTGSIVGDVRFVGEINNGTLAFNRSNLLNFGGVISGSGGVQQNGAGTTVLLGENTYTGGTTINAGTLQLGNGGTTGSIVGDVINNGTLAFNRSDLVSFDGLISGAGALLKRGNGTLVLTNANTYGGGTTIAEGTIVTLNASALGTGPLTLSNGTELEVIDTLKIKTNWTVLPGTATVSGGTVETFDFNLGGGGTLIADADFSVQGAANINSSGFVVNSEFTVDDTVNLNGSSTAVVNGSIKPVSSNVKDTLQTQTPVSGGLKVLLSTFPATATVNVNDTSSLIVNDLGTVVAEVNIAPDALLELFGTINGNVVSAGQFQGTGAVQGNVINSGLVSPGTSIGKLTIDGNYTQNASGTLRIEVAGTSSGQYDLLAVTGRADLAGRLQLVKTDDFELQMGDQISFLTADGGVNGTFDTVENDFLATGSMIVFDVVYLSNRVVLKGIQGSFAVFARDFCGTPNAVAVGQALDSVVGDSCASKLIDYLNEQTLTDLCEDLDLISPQQLSSIFVLGVSLANVQTSNLERRMHEVRSGSTGFSSAGFAVSGSGLSLAEGFAGVTGVEGKSGPPVYEPIPENRWGVFLTGLGEFTNVDGNFNTSGYDLSTGGFTMGVDYRIGSNFALGLTAGYTYTGTDLINDSNINVNGGKLGIYATAFSGGFYLDTAVVGGVSGYDTHRTALEGSANGDTTGGDLNVLLAGGYDWKTGGFSIGPTASFQYTLVGFDSFSETGSLAPLYYPSQDVDSYRTAIGMRASYDWKIGNVLFIPEFSASWQHEFGDTEYSLVSSFASGAGNSFTVSGPSIGRDSLLLGAGFAIHWNDRVSTYAYYDGELFRTNYLSNNVSVGVRVSF